MTVAHDANAVTHGHRFDLVVCDVDHGRAEPGVEFGNPRARGDAHFGVEIGKRFVEKEHLRLAHDRAADGDALTLPARECLGFAIEQVLDL
jgi:hypothetical protein